jgi:urease accessory protein UreF
VEIGGIPFCKRCARDQEAYFAVGELTQALTGDRAGQVQSFHRGEQLFETLRRMWRDNADCTVEDKTERAAAVGSLR